MNIGKIDKNMLVEKKISEDVVWHSATDTERFSMFGMSFDTQSGQFHRIPFETAEATSTGVTRLNYHTSGGRLCFVTDSTYVALWGKINGHVMSNMSWSGSGSFDLYCNDDFVGLFRSIPTGKQTELLFQVNLPLWRMGEGEHHMVLNFPLYAGVQELYIGVQEGCMLKADNPYREALPILYYGSSITQGASATRPGMLYQNYIARETHIDYLNLGWSGCAKGELAMAEHLASVPCSVFVCDWDHNLNTPEKLAEKHYPLYRIYRDRNSKTPIVFISRPDFDTHRTSSANRKVIIETVERAKAEGDRNVYFLDGETIFGTENRSECTTDGAHPTDLGFYRFYKALMPILRGILNEN